MKNLLQIFADQITKPFALCTFLILCLGRCFPLMSADSASTIQAKLIFSFGQKGEAPGQLSSPLGISTDPKGNIYVADTGNNRIQKFDGQGKLLAFIGGFGWDHEQFHRPVDICADNGLDVYVADYDNRRIEQFDKDLNWITSFVSDPTWPEKLQFGFPRSVSVSIHGDLFIVDSENKRILKLNSLRDPEVSFGDYDWGQGDLAEPVQAFISRTDKVHVTDSQLGLVLLFDYYGNYLSSCGEKVLSKPTGLCVSVDGYLFVADSELDQIVAFDPVGRPAMQIGSHGDKLGAFDRPSDVAVHQNRLFVADTDNHRVQVFELRLSGTP